MKIGIDARFWDESGVGRYIRNLVWQLQTLDTKNSYILFTTPDNQPKLTNQKWKIVPTNIHWHSLSEQLKFPSVINKENIDLMHFPYFSVPVLYTKPFIVTIHDLILHHFTTGEATTKSQLQYRLKLLAYKFIMKKAAQNSHAIITVSHATEDEIIKHLKVPPEKITLTYEGIYTNTNSQKSPDKNITFKKYLLHVGNLYPHKNMDTVINALSEIKKTDNLTMSLVIVGKEDYFYKKFKKKSQELNLQNQIKFIGEVNDSQLQNLYKNALALITPSLMEGFDLPSLEAMNSGCLVLASDIPVHREICQDAAVYFNLHDEKDLILKLKEIYNNGQQKYTPKIKKGKLISQNLTWKQMALETLRLYETILSK
jgi:glycosyltransferase involved in cell wall biosynthesis